MKRGEMSPARERPGSRKAAASAIIALAWPTIIEQIMHTAVQYIDTAMVGALGTEATAAVGATTTIGWLVFGVISAIGVGFLALIARACGADDRAFAAKAASQAVLAVLVCGSAATVICTSLSGVIPVWMRTDPAVRRQASIYFFIIYLPMLPRTASAVFGTVLRAAGDTKTPMKVGISVNLINVVLNYFLIFETRTVTLPFASKSFTVPGAGMGVTGAAIASAIAFTWGGVLMTAALYRNHKVSPRGLPLRPDMSILRPCAAIALPNMLQRVATSTGYVVFSAMINSLGGAATAAHTIAITVESAFYIPAYGMQTAASTLVGNAYGAGDRERMKSLAAMFIPIEVGLMVLTGGALFVSAPALVGIFSKSGEIIALGSTVLRMVALSEPFYGVSIITEGMMLGVGNTRLPFLFNAICMWGVRIVGTFICTRLLGLGLAAAWGCMIAHNMTLFVLYLICLVTGRVFGRQA